MKTTLNISEAVMKQLKSDRPNAVGPDWKISVAFLLTDRVRFVR